MNSEYPYLEVIKPDGSQYHCSLQYKNNCWWIIDQGSANGTFLQREIDKPEIDVRSEDEIVIRNGDSILILGELDAGNKPLFWRLEFNDPGETSQISNTQTVHFLEYSLSRQVLYRNLVRRRDSISLGEQERCLIDYMSRKNHQNNQSVICEYDELIQAIWHNDTFKRDRKTINHLVWRIRDKIELDSGEPQFLKTVKGRGYLLDRSLQEYILISQNAIEVEVYRKDQQGNWTVESLGKGDNLQLNSVGLNLTMADIYEDIF